MIASALVGSFVMNINKQVSQHMAVLDVFLVHLEDKHIKYSQGSMPLDPSERFGQDLIFAPLSWLLNCVGALQSLPGSALCTAFFPAISHHRDRRRLELHSRTVKSD